jgi:hypothetical protein
MRSTSMPRRWSQRRRCRRSPLATPGSKRAPTSCLGHLAAVNRIWRRRSAWPDRKGWRALFARTTDLVQKLQIARRDLALEATIAKLDKYHLLILDDLALCDQGSSRDQRFVRTDQRPLRTTIDTHYGQSTVRRMELNLPGVEPGNTPLRSQFYDLFRVIASDSRFCDEGSSCSILV